MGGYGSESAADGKEEEKLYGFGVLRPHMPEVIAGANWSGCGGILFGLVCVCSTGSGAMPVIVKRL
jgi:hypothetical protein